MSTVTVITDPGLLARVDALQQAYAHALDRHDMQGWLACFSSAGRYELTSAENVRLGLPVGMMLDDCHERLRDRVKYVNEVWANVVEHYQPRHMLSRDLCAWDEDGAIAASTNFSVFYTNAEGKSALLATGHYEDLIVEENGALRFAAKRTVMDTAVPPRYIIYPL